jgi:hypothetical protein
MNAAITSDRLKVPIGANHLFYGDNLDILRQRAQPHSSRMTPCSGGLKLPPQCSRREDAGLERSGERTTAGGDPCG